jgi:hypothetical protein
MLYAFLTSPMRAAFPSHLNQHMCLLLTITLTIYDALLQQLQNPTTNICRIVINSLSIPLTNIRSCLLTNEVIFFASCWTAPCQLQTSFNAESEMWQWLPQAVWVLLVRN